MAGAFALDGFVVAGHTCSDEKARIRHGENIAGVPGMRGPGFGVRGPGGGGGRNRGPGSGVRGLGERNEQGRKLQLVLRSEPTPPKHELSLFA
jgi:hypothetical protein